MQRHVKAREAGERICLIVIFYEVCLFLFLWDVILLKRLFPRKDRCLRQRKVRWGPSEVFYYWGHEETKGFMIHRVGLSENTTKDSVRSGEVCLGEESS